MFHGIDARSVVRVDEVFYDGAGFPEGEGGVGVGNGGDAARPLGLRGSKGVFGGRSFQRGGGGLIKGGMGIVTNRDIRCCMGS